MNTSNPRRWLSARALTFGVAALLAAVAPYQAVAEVPIITSTGSNTWTNVRSSAATVR